MSFSSTVFYAEVRYGSLHTISERKPEGHRFRHIGLTWVLMVHITKREIVCSFLSFFHIKHSQDISHLKRLIKIKLLVEMLVLCGGNRFYFYANKKVNYRHEKQNYNAIILNSFNLCKIEMAEWIFICFCCCIKGVFLIKYCDSFMLIITVIQ